jgi:MraZ protein
MFAGTYRVKVDAKGRLAIPARFRAELPVGSHISIGADSVLAIYTPKEFERVAEAIPAQWQATGQQREFRRLLYSLAQPCDFDGQGRVTLSQEQRRYSRVEPGAMAVVVGAGDLVEIWPEASWDSYSAAAQPRFTDLVSEVFRPS